MIHIQTTKRRVLVKCRMDYILKACQNADLIQLNEVYISFNASKAKYEELERSVAIHTKYIVEITEA